MPVHQTSEAPLDLLQSARDELVQGRSPGHLAPQANETTVELAMSEPAASPRCDTAQREVVEQSEVLSANPAIQATVNKPR